MERGTSPAVRIVGLAGDVGTVHPIAELAVPEAEREELTRRGLTWFARCDRKGLFDLVRRCVRSSLGRAGISAGDVDRLIFATNDFVQETDRFVVPELACELGLQVALPLGISQGFCTNFSLAFEVASCLIASQYASNVLFITADRYWSDEARVLRNRAGIGSDGAASCLLTREIRPGYALRSVAHACAPEVVELQAPDRAIDYIRAYAAGYSRACSEALSKASLDSRSCEWLVGPHFSPSVRKNLIELAGYDAHRAYFDNAETLGHCNSVDQILALRDLELRLPEGVSVLVSGAADHLWGAAVVTRVDSRDV
jgi:3-oxoacyl-[acyl-carrier-protein] synthase III